MEMDNTVGTITQVFSVVDRMPTPYESVRPALENALNRKSTLVGNSQPGSSTTRTSLHHLTPQNFRIILRSSYIVKECPAFRFDVRTPCLALVPTLRRIASIVTVTCHSGETA